MKSKFMRFVLCAVMLLGMPAVSMAQDEESKIYDARLENYPGNVTLPSSTALMWLLLVILGAACVGVMFKQAKRTHLD